ncbi:MAG: flagellin [Alicyclobacillus macrosporangiidus]|uniref:flagellin N-terminal helical domain-containing protein n=1 Tax=Alicyclobacillus macrosporangiidus TaxID=392015 RepID=UPI0026EF2394|nr:flagellin [Alicyclobacillus macrosporangiidus]MCL6598702.1 flagellin [Alicyclobacillus macrosporangiidus]
MSFTINTNIAAMNTLFSLNINQSAMQKAEQQLSSGYKINSAADDAAGLAIATKMTNQITGLTRATQNAQDGLSMLQTMEGGISSIEDMLGRMRDLALEAANGTATTSDRTQIYQELAQLQQEIDRTAKSVQFNTKTLLTGLAQGGLVFQVGANAGQNQVISLKVAKANMQTSTAGLAITKALQSFWNTISGKSNLSQQSKASGLVDALDKALSTVSLFRANVGAVEDRLNFAISNLGVENNNLSTAKSRIMDTDMAATMTQFTKEQILVNAGISMLAQANQTPGMVLKLLG